MGRMRKGSGEKGQEKRVRRWEEGLNVGGYMEIPQGFI